MKKGLLHLLFLLPIALLASPVSHYDGWYEDVYSGETIEVDVRKRSIKVRGLCGDRWVKFRPTYGTNEYVDRRGNRLRLRANREIVYFDRRDWQRRRFVRLGWGRDGRGSCDARPRDRYDGDYGYYDRNQYEDRFTMRLEGRWRADLIRDYVYIEETRNGIRAKIGRDGRWTNYTVSRYNARKYVDDRGNVLLINGDQSLTWQGRGYKDIRLTRDRY